MKTAYLLKIVGLKPEVLNQTIFSLINSPIFVSGEFVLFIIFFLITGCSTINEKNKEYSGDKEYNESGWCTKVLNNETDFGWKVYKDIQYNFSFEYPSDWQVYESERNENLLEKSITIRANRGLLIGFGYVFKKSVNGKSQKIQDSVSILSKEGEVLEKNKNGTDYYRIDKAHKGDDPYIMYMLFDKGGHVIQFSFAVYLLNTEDDKCITDDNLKIVKDIFDSIN